MHSRYVYTSTGMFSYGESRPWLNLYGKWLDKAGFHIGEPIFIKVSKNKLVITKLKTTKNENASSEKHQQPEENEAI